jgi:hypothetical protein
MGVLIFLMHGMPPSLTPQAEEDRLEFQSTLHVYDQQRKASEQHVLALETKLQQVAAMKAHSDLEFITLGSIAMKLAARCDGLTQVSKEHLPVTHLHWTVGLRGCGFRVGNMCVFLRGEGGASVPIL